MKLIITEKPSCAMTVAKVIGVHKRRDGYLEDNGYLVSWCVGHLVELAPPQSYGEQYSIASGMLPTCRSCPSNGSTLYRRVQRSSSVFSKPSWSAAMRKVLSAPQMQGVRVS